MMFDLENSLLYKGLAGVDQFSVNTDYERNKIHNKNVKIHDNLKVTKK